MLAGNTTREVESDTVAEKELKTVKRNFGGLNEGIWPKSSLGRQTSCARWTFPEGVALVSCENMQVGSDVQKDGSVGEKIKFTAGLVYHLDDSWISNGDVQS
ncbi:hypothetical protein F511_44811 [Dorcoceras hygrometricum]|uniref:Uncharacterized protein n=1 Tax=Dorcoceras hygrometricum TaxID=472368 RepID=A0A2Z7CM93_9LAMI|nr:hypothetical protein F511_44811 [Dorcoceras hygrometricum]